MINDIILKNLDEEFINADITRLRKEWTHYQYKEFGVPRVTEIVKLANLNSEALVKWANAMGFKRLSSAKLKEQAANIGTLVHESIESYIKTGYGIDTDSTCETENDAFIVRTAVNGFKEFWKKFRFKDQIEDTLIEQTVLTPYFGGTYDLLIKLKDGRNFLYDFKTTNHISETQFIQLSAYIFALRTYYNINVHGTGILLINKNIPKCDEYFIDFSIPQNKLFIDQCEKSFLSVLYSFYNLKETQYQFKDYLSNRE